MTATIEESLGEFHLTLSDSKTGEKWSLQMLNHFNDGISLTVSREREGMALWIEDPEAHAPQPSGWKAPPTRSRRLPMSAAPVIKSDRHAFLTGAMLGMLMKSADEGVLNLRPEANVDHDGNYTNVIALRDPRTTRWCSRSHSIRWPDALVGRPLAERAHPCADLRK